MARIKIEEDGIGIATNFWISEQPSFSLKEFRIFGDAMRSPSRGFDHFECLETALNNAPPRGAALLVAGVEGAEAIKAPTPSRCNCDT